MKKLNRKITGIILLVLLVISCNKKQVKEANYMGYCMGSVACIDCMEKKIQKEHSKGITPTKERLENIEKDCYFENRGEF